MLSGDLIHLQIAAFIVEKIRVKVVLDKYKVKN